MVISFCYTSRFTWKPYVQTHFHGSHTHELASMNILWMILCSSLQRERASAVERAEELQKQLSELHRDHEKLRKALALNLQKKVCYKQQLPAHYGERAKGMSVQIVLCVVQMYLIEEHRHQNEQQLKATKQSLKEKETEYFELEVGWLICV